MERWAGHTYHGGNASAVGTALPIHRAFVGPFPKKHPREGLLCPVHRAGLPAGPAAKPSQTCASWAGSICPTKYVPGTSAGPQPSWCPLPPRWPQQPRTSTRQDPLRILPERLGLLLEEARDLLVTGAEGPPGVTPGTPHAESAPNKWARGDCGSTGGSHRDQGRRDGEGLGRAEGLRVGEGRSRRCRGRAQLHSLRARGRAEVSAPRETTGKEEKRIRQITKNRYSDPQVATRAQPAASSPGD